MARTGWEDWYAEVERAFDELRAASDEIFVMGMSMGGCLALRLAELHGSEVSGLVLVNPSVTAESRLFLLAPVLKRIVPSLPGLGSDIKKDGVTELAYDRVPVKAAATLPGLWRITRASLDQVRQPVLIYRSSVDHVVGPANLEILRRALPAGQLEVIMCENSYHVATLDNDAETIFAGSLEFVRAHSHAARE
jgi:carboxylesterase